MGSFGRANPSAKGRGQKKEKRVVYRVQSKRTLRAKKSILKKKHHPCPSSAKPIKKLTQEQQNSNGNQACWVPLYKTPWVLFDWILRQSQFVLTTTPWRFPCCCEKELVILRYVVWARCTCSAVVTLSRMVKSPRGSLLRRWLKFFSCEVLLRIQPAVTFVYLLSAFE